MQYKVVMHSAVIQVNNKKNLGAAADYLTNLLNNYAAEGWQYHSIKEFYVTTKKNGKADSSAVAHYMIVFCKEGTPQAVTPVSTEKPKKSFFDIFKKKKQADAVEGEMPQQHEQQE